MNVPAHLIYPSGSLCPQNIETSLETHQNPVSVTPWEGTSGNVHAKKYTSLKQTGIYSHIPHVFQSVNGQQVGGHGKVQFIDERSDLRRRIQQVNDGGSQIIQLSLETQHIQFRLQSETDIYNFIDHLGQDSSYSLTLCICLYSQYQMITQFELNWVGYHKKYIKGICEFSSQNSHFLIATEDFLI